MRRIEKILSLLVALAILAVPVTGLAEIPASAGEASQTPQVEGTPSGEASPSPEVEGMPSGETPPPTQAEGTPSGEASPPTQAEGTPSGETPPPTQAEGTPSGEASPSPQAEGTPSGETPPSPQAGETPAADGDGLATEDEIMLLDIFVDDLEPDVQSARAIYLILYNGYIHDTFGGGEVARLTLFEDGNVVALPEIAENSTYEHTGWMTYRKGASGDEPVQVTAGNTLSFGEMIDFATGEGPTYTMELYSAYALKPEGARPYALWMAQYTDEQSTKIEKTEGSLIVYPDDPQKRYELPDLATDCWYLTSVGEDCGIVALKDGYITYESLAEYIRSERLDADNLLVVRPLLDEVEAITVQFYTAGTQYYWDREMVAQVRFEKGHAAKSIPAIEERAGQVGYWQGFNQSAGGQWNQVKFEDAESLTYEECLEILGQSGTQAGSAVIQVCARYETEPLTVGESRVVVHLILNESDREEIGTVVLSSSTPEAQAPLTYLLPTGLELTGWQAGARGSQKQIEWGADKTSVSYREMVDAFFSDEQMLADGVADVYAYMRYRADGDNPVTIYMTYTLDDEEVYGARLRPGGSAALPADKLTAGRDYAWYAQYYRDDSGFSSVELDCDALLEALAGGEAIGYEQLLAALPADGIIEDFGAPTAQIEIFGESGDQSPGETSAEKTIALEMRVCNWDFDVDEETTRRETKTYTFYLTEADSAISFPDGRTLSQVATGGLLPGCVSGGWKYVGGAANSVPTIPADRDEISFAQLSECVDWSNYALQEGGYDIARLTFEREALFTSAPAGTTVKAVVEMRDGLTGANGSLTLTDASQSQKLPVLVAPKGLRATFNGWRVGRDGYRDLSGTVTLSQLLNIARSGDIDADSVQVETEYDWDTLKVTGYTVTLWAEANWTYAAQDPAENRMTVQFYNRFSRPLTACTLSSATPAGEEDFELPKVTAPAGKVFNGWSLARVDETGRSVTARLYADREDISYEYLRALLRIPADARGLAAEITAYPLFAAAMTLDPNQPVLTISAQGATRPEGGEKYYVGRYVKFTLTLDGYDQIKGDRDISWSVSNTNVVRPVSQSGGSAVFQSHKKAYADVTITAKIRNHHPVSVVVHANNVPTSISVSGPNFVLRSTEEKTYTAKLTAKLGPSGARPNAILWSTSDEDVATISASGATCYVTGHALGPVTITAATETGLARQWQMNVTEPAQTITLTSENAFDEVGYKGRLYLNAVVEPATALQDVALTTTGRYARYARVAYDSARGQWYVTGLRLTGSALVTLRATARDGSGVQDDLGVRVIVAATGISAPAAAHTFLERTASLSLSVLPRNATNRALEVELAEGGGDIVRLGSDHSITGLKVGTTQITVTEPHSGISVVIPVSVTVPVESVTIAGEEERTLELGKTLALTAEALPEEAHYRDVAWSIPGKYARYARVSADGVVTALRKGRVPVYATARDGSGEHNYIWVQIVQGVTSVRLSASSLSLTVGEEGALPRAAAYPTNASGRLPITWSVAEESKDVVSVDNDAGTLTALRAGTAEIYAAAPNGVRAACAVTVYDRAESLWLNGERVDQLEEPIEIGVGYRKTAGIALTAQPATARQTFQWTTGNRRYVTVNSGGTVRGVRGGKAVVTARATDGSGLEVSFEVAVYSPTTRVQLRTASLSLDVGEDARLEYRITPANATTQTYEKPVWTSADEDVATVDSEGNVTATGYGTTTVTLRAGARSASCTVRVYKQTGKIEIAAEAGVVPVKGYLQLTAAATDVDGGGDCMQEFTWATSNRRYATVSSTGVVKGVRAGNVSVRAIAKDGSGEYAQFDLYVYTPVSRLQLRYTSLVMRPGDTGRKLEARITPYNARYKDITWTSSDESVLTVSDNGSFCLISAHACGTATVTATADGKTAACVVQVAKPTKSIAIVPAEGEMVNNTLSVALRRKNQTLQLNALATDADGGGDALKTFTWGSSNSRVARVSSTGAVTIYRTGTVMIKAIAKDNARVYKVITLKVVAGVMDMRLSKTDLSLSPGQTASLSVRFSPTYPANRGLLWTIECPEGVAMIDQSGRVTACKPGLAVVTARSLDNPSVEKTCLVTIGNTGTKKLN